jgi:hypothetical protein
MLLSSPHCVQVLVNARVTREALLAHALVACMPMQYYELTRRAATARVSVVILFMLGLRLGRLVCLSTLASKRDA